MATRYFFKVNSASGGRFVLLLVSYIAALSASRWLSYQLRFDFRVPEPFLQQMLLHWGWVLLFKLFLLYVFDQFSGLPSYFSLPDLRKVVAMNLAAFVILVGVHYTFPDFYKPPRAVLLLDLVLSSSAIISVRLGFRLLRERTVNAAAIKPGGLKRVAIVGAGDVGAQLCKDLLAKRSLGMQPVVFFDDDSSKWRSRIHGIPVVGAPESLPEHKLSLNLDEAIIAMPSAPPKRIREVLAVLHGIGLHFETVPSLDQLATGRVKVSQLRSVEIEDLLGRDPVELETGHIGQLLQNKVVMVTGAGGSIGSELCRQIAGFNPQRVLLVEQAEVQIFQIEQELIGLGCGAIILPLVADVLDAPRMRHIFERFKPAVVFHAAAHKHVPMMELQPGEAIKNNILGTARLADLAAEFGVERFVLISTDKAINPTSVMGASKRVAELYLQALAASAPGSTKFMAVRFGNVLGSSGSVIPIFKKQIARGGPVKVTHPEVTRYFMTIPEATGLVLQSASQGAGGEIFVLDMGKPIKIVDLARQMIELSGFKPGEDIQIEFSGLRPGEKLFEELSHSGENIAPTHHSRIMRFVSAPADLGQMRAALREMEENAHELDPAPLKLLLKKAVPEYTPHMG